MRDKILSDASHARENCGRAATLSVRLFTAEHQISSRKEGADSKGTNEADTKLWSELSSEFCRFVSAELEAESFKVFDVANP